MPAEKKHIVWVLANCSSAPYFSWIAKLAVDDPEFRFTFVNLYHEEPEMIAEMKALGHEAHWIKFDHTRRISSLLSVTPKLKNFFSKLKPAVVHTHLFDDSLPALTAARLARVPMRVITKGDTGFHWYFAKKGVKYDRLNNNNATHIIALSQESKKFIGEKEGADLKKISLIPHGIPVNELSLINERAEKKLRKQFNLSEKDTVIGSVARFVEWKGYRAIVNAAEIVVKEFPNAKFLLAGNGPQREEIIELIRKKKLVENIIVTGWIEHEDMPSFFRIMDVFLHAATMEPFGFVIAEAMANRVPVVSATTGAAADVIENGKNGMLIGEVSAEKISETLKKILRMSPDERKKIGEAAGETAWHKFSIERMWRDHLALYRKGSAE
ncbi:MAG: glycosyltransferase family 4 protein [Bacteroidetes bacterium]|nr:glycosyltransferase family 4 protein [Bacteroidota bacterium]